MSIEVVTVFDVADERGPFIEYLAYLHAVGVRPSPEAWLQESACRLMGTDSPDLQPPTYLEDAWTLRRRRLLAVLTWPQPVGGRALKFPFGAETDAGVRSLTGVFGRSYPELWADVRDNLKALVMLAQQRGSWDVLAREWSLRSNVLWEPARLGLVRAPDGRAISNDVVDGLMSDRWDRPSRARDGFVLTWWDIVAVAECAGYSFEPLDDHSPGDQGRMVDGRYVWNRSDLLNRIGMATVARRSAHDILRAAEADATALRNPELNPLELHRRITAGGRIEPPAVGSKYRPLFEQLDAMDFVGVHGAFTLTSDELAEVLSQVKPGLPRALRGARGVSGLPTAALTTEQWWYGPWNPNIAESDSKWATVGDQALTTSLGKKSHTRAWMAAGLRAKPSLRKGRLVEVAFEPVLDRRYWWPWRSSLRDGTYASLIVE